MSFKEPLFLLALLALPAAMTAYGWFERRRRRAAERFAAPALVPSIAPRRPGLRRHAPLALYAIALAALLVALARPEATVAVPEERAAVMLLTDISGSMQAHDVQPSRMAAARRAALGFIDDAPDDLRVGAVSFNHQVQELEPPRAEREQVAALLARLRPSGGTATGEALAAGIGVLERGVRRERAPAAVILLSDGASTHGRDPLPEARRAARLRIPVYTVALGTASGTIRVRRPDGSTEVRTVPPDRETMRRIAVVSGGRTYSAAAGEELGEVYERLGSRVATRPERREITSAFVAGGALMLLFGGVLSLRWFGRLP